MIRFLKISCILSILSLISCINEELPEELVSLGDDEVVAMIPFSHAEFEEINISTKATLREEALDLDLALFPRSLKSLDMTVFKWVKLQSI